VTPFSVIQVNESTTARHNELLYVDPSGKQMVARNLTSGQMNSVFSVSKTGWQICQLAVPVLTASAQFQVVFTTCAGGGEYRYHEDTYRYQFAPSV
jgi:hypothetical protein